MILEFLENLFQKSEYKIKSQKTDFDCGPTIVSILGGDYYSLMRDFKVAKGTSVVAMQKMLDSINLNPTLNYVRKNRKKLKSYRKIKGAYLIRAKNENYGHWVLIDKLGNVYDTEIVKISKVLDYDRRLDEVIAYFEL